AEMLARSLVGRRYLHEFLDRAGEPGITNIGVRADFTAWLGGRPEIVRTLDLLHSHPYVEKYSFQVDLKDWETAIEVCVGLIPIVGTIVGLAEASLGTSLMGRELSPIEQGITGAASLIPVAGKL